VTCDSEHDERFQVRRGNGARGRHSGTDASLQVAHLDALEGASPVRLRVG
jgi:hypothetical protein